MKQCLKCGKRVRSNQKPDLCKQCLAVCECGAFKDWRAERCRSCASKIQTKKQWQTLRGKMLDGMVKAGVRRRRKYDDLREEHFKETKLDGRKFARYTDESGRLRAIYIYQWIWRQANGDIPKGLGVHHKDGDHFNNDLSNLELLTKSEHARIHGKERGGLNRGK